MIRRLGGSQGLRPPPELLIPGVQPPSPTQGNCSLVACLQRALTVTDQQAGATYSQLMGLGGPAFMLHIEPDLQASLAEQGRAEFITEALQALGYHGQRLAGLSPSDWQAAISSELQAGRPVVVTGWGSLPGEWALVTGRQDDQWSGWSQGGRGEPEKAPGEPTEAIITGPPGPPAAETAAWAQALPRAATLLARSQRAYELWGELMHSDRPFGEPPGVHEKIAAYKWLLDCLADARFAGYEFMLEAAFRLPAAAEAGLAEVAEWLLEVSEKVEQLLTMPLAGRGDDPGDDPGWLTAQHRGLMAAAQAETDALGRLYEVMEGAGIRAEIANKTD